jgi:hypothetical protein
MRTLSVASVLFMALSLGLAASASAAIITIDFEDLAVPLGTQLNPASGVSQNSGGFTFTPGPDDSSGLNDLHFHNENGIGDNGTIHLGTHDDVVMTMIGGGSFTLLRFQFQGWNVEPEDFNVSAVLEGGGVVSVDFFPDATASTFGVTVPYDSFAAGPLFTNVKSVTWDLPVGFGFDGFFLDNIVVEIPDGAAPEPSSLVLLLGAGLVGIWHRRRLS